MIHITLALDDEEARSLEIALRRVHRLGLSANLGALRSTEELRAANTALDKISLALRLKTSRR